MNLVCDHILGLTHSTVTITALIPEHHMQLLGNVFRCTLSEFATAYVNKAKKKKKKLISCKNCKIKGFLHEQTDEIFGIEVISILFICSVGPTLPPHPAKDSCQALDKSLAAISMTWLACKGLGGIPALRIQLQVEEHNLEYVMTAISTHWHLQSFFLAHKNLCSHKHLV